MSQSGSRTRFTVAEDGVDKAERMSSLKLDTIWYQEPLTFEEKRMCPRLAQVGFERVVLHQRDGPQKTRLRSQLSRLYE